MALRKLVAGDSAVLRAQAHPVRTIDRVILNLLDDMAETMYHAKGVGLAAPQIGISKQLVVIDIGDGRLLELINPVLLEARGEVLDLEGCLSLPGISGDVPRAEWVAVQALDRQGREFRLEGEGLLARALQHELDHLQGILFIDRAKKILEPGESPGEDR